MVSVSRRFRPRLWAASLTLVFAAITIHLGNWQGSRAEYKLEQQRQLDTALAAPAMNVFDVPSTSSEPQPSSQSLPSDADNDAPVGVRLRYRSVNLVGEFQPNTLFFLDNKIQDGKAGYGVAQLFRAQRGREVDVSDPANVRWLIVDRGWVEANLDRSKLPQLDTPRGVVELKGRINLPISRNPGAADNDAASPRLNYVNLDELRGRLKLPTEAYMVEQLDGAGFLNTPRAAPAANYQKNRAYQVQWYAFAALAVILFLLLSFKKEPTA